MYGISDDTFTAGGSVYAAEVLSCGKGHWPQYESRAHYFLKIYRDISTGQFPVVHSRPRLGIQASSFGTNARVPGSDLRIKISTVRREAG
jgi:hypothetical protein